MVGFMEWLGVVAEGSNPGTKTVLYPLGYGGIGLYPPQWYPTRSADAIFYMSIDERIYKGSDGGEFDITQIPGEVMSSMDQGEGGIWDISRLGGSPNRSSGRNYAANSGNGGMWDISHIKGPKGSSGRDYAPEKGEKGLWNIRHIPGGDKNEQAGGYAIVGCEDSPNYQVWGARSDLRCRKKKSKILDMKFRDWVKSKGRM